ncbi:CAP domain-containing protein [Deinococcus sp. DB0503]|uniref:CAP domain-containing protein n=1 Tax=Deinococcus sp. DB0503 TaxID=2479203 RepID=UPI0018DEF217|nr:CAP domain-containing protein [Deinococcus sp. DB0503]MBI0444532.1 CAP domain-containing protein [Deinococcus sp. DB0503]
MLRAKQTFVAALVALACLAARAQTPAEAGLLAGLNRARAQGVTCPGLGRRPVAAPLVASGAHALAARMQAGYMASSGRITHMGAGGSTPRVRAASTGVRAVSVTEIVYLGAGVNPEAAVRWWLRSPVHCSVLTDARYTHAGASVVQGARGTASVVVLSSQPR